MRLDRIKKKYDEQGVAGVFKTDGSGLSLLEMAHEMWKSGYIPEPTIEALVNEIEKDFEKRDKGIITRGASYVHEWEFYFSVTDPKGVPVPAKHIRDLEDNIKRWVNERDLQVQSIYTGSKPPDEDEG